MVPEQTPALLRTRLVEICKPKSPDDFLQQTLYKALGVMNHCISALKVTE